MKIIDILTEADLGELASIYKSTTEPYLVAQLKYVLESRDFIDYLFKGHGALRDPMDYVRVFKLYWGDIVGSLGELYNIEYENMVRKTVSGTI